ncbi:hypothetical protein [Brevibacterium zhoupengii]|nr:hypothetical protein [Brevibacterium zhoupengii]
MTDDARLVEGLARLHAVVRTLVTLPNGVWVDGFDRSAVRAQSVS